jgi:peroxiredoxin
MSSQITATDVRQTIEQAFKHARDLDGSINKRLDTFANAVRKQHPSSAAIVDRMVNRLREHGAGDAAPKLGELMPPFVLPDEAGRLVSLKSLLEHGPAVVTFNRGHWCPYCRISINALANAQQRIQDQGARMVAIIPERAEYAAEMKTDANVRFPILSDIDNGYAMVLSLAIWVGQEMEEFMRSIGRDLPKYQGNDSWMLPIPATFVVGTDGRVKARFIDPDYRKRMAIEELIDCLKL